MRRTLGLAFGLVIAMSLTAMAGSAPSVSDARAEIEALKARLASLETQRGETWLNERRAEEVKTLVREVLSDADTRASLLAEGATSGHDGGNFWVGSADGSFLLKISGIIQVRHTWNSRDDVHDEGVGRGPADASDDNNEMGFTIPRAKVQFAGHISSPRIQYALRLAVDKDTNDVWADKIVVTYCLLDNLWISAGEDKGPFLREELTEAEHQLAVDRSLVNELFSIGRVQGVWMNWYASDMIHFAASINDGATSGERQGFDDPNPILGVSSKDFDQDHVDFSVTARVDVKLAGNWEQVEDFTAWSGEPFAAFIGAAVHYQVRETGDSIEAPAPLTGLVGHSFDTLLWTIDGSVECHGFNFYAAVVGASFDADHDLAGEVNPDPLGVVVQAGYQIIPDKLEPFVRWEFIDFDIDPTPGDHLGQDDDTVNILTFGANWYLNRHASKFTIDLLWCLDPIPDIDGGFINPTNASAAALGLLPDNEDGDDQIALRSQFTLTF